MYSILWDWMMWQWGYTGLSWCPWGEEVELNKGLHELRQARGALRRVWEKNKGVSPQSCVSYQNPGPVTDNFLFTFSSCCCSDPLGYTVSPQGYSRGQIFFFSLCSLHSGSPQWVTIMYNVTPVFTPNTLPRHVPPPYLSLRPRTSGDWGLRWLCEGFNDL